MPRSATAASAGNRDVGASATQTSACAPALARPCTAIPLCMRHVLARPPPADSAPPAKLPQSRGRFQGWGPHALPHCLATWRGLTGCCARAGTSDLPLHQRLCGQLGQAVPLLRQQAVPGAGRDRAASGHRHAPADRLTPAPGARPGLGQVTAAPGQRYAQEGLAQAPTPSHGPGSASGEGSGVPRAGQCLACRCPNFLQEYAPAVLGSALACLALAHPGSLGQGVGRAHGLRCMLEASTGLAGLPIVGLHVASTKHHAGQSSCQDQSIIAQSPVVRHCSGLC